jgi:hypothetical protein
MAASEHWKDEPDDHDYPAAASYLSLVFPVSVVDVVVNELRRAVLERFKAKDLLRASGLPSLPADNVHVEKDLKKVKAGTRLSPVLIVRGDARRAVAMVIADGYHRICASHLLDEDADIPCRIVDLPDPAADR